LGKDVENSSRQTCIRRAGKGRPHVKVLITGGAGFIGSTVASAAADAGITPVILDDLSRGRREFAADRAFYAGDIADGELIDRIFDEHPDIDATVHCAAKIVVPESVADPLLYYGNNVSKTVSLLGHVIRRGCPRLLFSSSASIYAAGPPPDFAVDEESPLATQSPYGASKLMVESILADVSVAYPLRALSLRYFNPIGADPQMRTGLQDPAPTHAMGKLLEARQTATPFTITGVTWPTRDGTGIRDYIHVWDLAVGHVKALQLFDDILPGDHGHTAINLGTGKGTTVRELIDAFQDVAGELEVREAGPRPGDVAGCCTRNDKARRLLGWTAEHSVRDGVRDALAWLDRRREVLGF
jgi:UDP-glucose 4-epimerase